MEASLMADENVDPPPAVNWSLVDDDQEWQRKEGSKSAPPKLNVSGFPGADNMFFYRPGFEISKSASECREDGYDEGYRVHPNQAHLPPPLGATFQEFINSVTKLTDSPDVTPSQSLHSSFSSMPAANASFTSLLLKGSGSQQSRLDRKGKHVEPFAMVSDSPAMLPADHHGAIPIRIPGFGTSPQAQSFLLGTPPASLSSLGGEPYMVNNSPSAGNIVLPSGATLAAPHATWPRQAFTGIEDQIGKPKKEIPPKHKGQRLTFQESKEPQAKPKQSAPKEELAQGTQGESQPPRSGPQTKDARNAGKGGAAVERRLFPALEGEIDGHFSTLEDVLGNIYLTAKDQYGCRFLQKMLEDGSPQCIQQILDEVYDHSVELMTDPFGNYLMQKLVEHCNDDQRTLVAQKVAPQLVNISLNMHGTRAVQTLIENLTSATQVQIIIGALQDSVVPLIKDLNGNHVIQRCLQKFTAMDKQFVYDAAIPRCVDVATHRHGCCVVQRCIDHASEEQRLHLTDEIAKHAFTLVTDPFGNYVVQYVLNLNMEQMVRKICAAFSGCFANLCMNKFSSNVMEKCLQISPDDVQEGFINELMDPSLLPKLLQDQYANYVVQTALSVSKPQQFAQLQEAIRSHLHLVRNTPYGKKIENKLNRGAGRSVPGGRGKNKGGATQGGGGMGGRGYGAGQQMPQQFHGNHAHHRNSAHAHGHGHAPGHMNHNHAHHMGNGMPHMAHMMQGGAPAMQGPMPGMPPSTGHRMGPGKQAMAHHMMPQGSMGMGGMEPRGDSWDDSPGHPYWT